MPLKKFKVKTCFDCCSCLECLCLLEANYNSDLLGVVNIKQTSSLLRM